MLTLATQANCQNARFLVMCYFSILSFIWETCATPSVSAHWIEKCIIAIISYFVIGSEKTVQKMGKTRKNLKYAVNSSQKQSLDEQLTSGRVARSKNKVKIRMRAEEDEVRTSLQINKTITKYGLSNNIWTERIQHIADKN